VAGSVAGTSSSKAALGMRRLQYCALVSSTSINFRNKVMSKLNDAYSHIQQDSISVLAFKRIFEAETEPRPVFQNSMIGYVIWPVMIAYSDSQFWNTRESFPKIHLSVTVRIASGDSLGMFKYLCPVAHTNRMFIG
jgi:hypothetical protein